MEVRFLTDRETGDRHILRHGVSEAEAIELLERPLQEYAGRNGATVCLGQTAGGRYLGIVYVPGPGGGSVFVITGYELGSKALKALRRHLRKGQR